MATTQDQEKKQEQAAQVEAVKAANAVKAQEARNTASQAADVRRREEQTSTKPTNSVKPVTASDAVTAAAQVGKTAAQIKAEREAKQAEIAGLQAQLAGAKTLQEKNLIQNKINEASQSVLDMQKSQTQAETKDAFDIPSRYDEMVQRGTQAAQNITGGTVETMGAVPASQMSAAQIQGQTPGYTAAQMQQAQVAATDAIKAAQMQDAAQMQQAQVAATDAIKAAQIGDAAYGTEQQQLIQALQSRMAGQAPSVAEQQLQRTTEQNLAQLMAAQAATGGPAGLKARELARQQASVQQEAAGQAAILRAQEQTQAEQTAASAIQTARGQEMQQAQQQATLEQQTSLANQQAQLQTALAQGQIDQATFEANMNAINQQMSQNANLQQQAALANQQTQLQTALAQGQIDQATFEANMNAVNQASQLKAQLQQQRDLTQAELDQAANMENARLEQEATNLGYTTEADRRKFVAQMQLEAQKAQEAIKQSYVQMGMSQELAAQAAKQDYYKMMNSNELAEKDAKTRIEIAKITGQASGGGLDWSSIISSGVAAAVPAAIAAFSDENLKKDIKEGDSDIMEFMDALKAYMYRYKDEDEMASLRPGVMAQDVEQGGEIGRSLVIETPIGKALDVKKGFGAVLAATANLNERLKEIESRKSKKGKK